MEEAIIEKAPTLPPFGTVQNPVAMMEHEHDSAGNVLGAMREISHGYAAPSDACVSYQTLYTALAELIGHEEPERCRRERHGPPARATPGLPPSE